MGDGVNVAARLEQLCLPGGVVISGTTYDHLQGRFELPLDFLGEHKVKNITRPLRVYSVRLDGKKPTFTRRLRTGGRVGWGLTVVTVALFALAAFGWRNLSTRSPQAPVIAVLPFKNYGPDADARLVGGLTEDIVTDLARNGGFLVISNAATKVYEGKPLDLSAVQKELNVRYLLEGSVQRQDDRVKITAQVLDAITGASLWSERYDRPSGEFFDLQGEIADKVANWIYFTIGSAEKSVAKRKRPTDLTAWEVFLLGADKLGIATDTTVHEAQDLFFRAISMDPKLARAHALLSETYEIQSQTAQAPDDLLDKAVASARAAIELDPLDFEGYLALADALCSKGSYDVCKLEYERALQISPNAFEVLVSYAGWASALGAAKEGAEAADRAIRMFPAYPVFAALSISLCVFDGETIRGRDQVRGAHSPRCPAAVRFRGVRRESWPCWPHRGRKDRGRRRCGGIPGCSKCRSASKSKRLGSARTSARAGGHAEGWFPNMRARKRCVGRSDPASQKAASWLFYRR